MSDARTENQALNRLIEICHDGHDGYQIAAQNVEDRDLQRVLARFAHERGEYRDQLARKVDRHAGAPHEHGTIKGKLHRTWMDLKAKVRDLTPPEIVRMCIEGEDASLTVYEEVLKGDLPSEKKDLVTEQLGGIQKARNRLLELTGGPPEDAAAK